MNNTENKPIMYYFKNPDGSLSKLMDEQGNESLIGEYIKELTKKHNVTILAVVQGGL